MPQEIEIKLKVESHDAVRERLRASGAQARGRLSEVNHILDNAQRTLLANDCGLRVRECRDDDGRLVQARLTYKGPREAGPVKRREEIECTIDDPAALRGVLAALGFVEVVCFEKRRETWHLGECAIELDELPHLGCFVEIEGPDAAAIQRARTELGLDDSPPIHGTYISLLVDHCRAMGLPTNQIHF